MDYILAVAVAVSLFAAGHAVVYKRDSRSAAIWVLVVWLLPGAGAVLYALLGVNRVQRRAAKLRRDRLRYRPPPLAAPQLAAAVPGANLAPLARMMSAVAERPLLSGNSVAPLVGGAEAYPAMLDAIEGARRSIALASYIFQTRGIGTRFVEALVRAHRRDVAVRVLVDDVDARFTRFSAVKPLRKAGVPTGVFNPPLVPARLNAFNLRNHRKILVVDGMLGFTGGMNIDPQYWQPEQPEAAFRDLHFRLRGPVVAQLMDVFADDWHFATDDSLHGSPWFPDIAPAGPLLARVIEEGPDESPDRLRWSIIGGLNAAQRAVRILTPYFVPDAPLVSALNAAALRGVEVDIVLPEKSDLPHVHWAGIHGLWQVLERGCRVWMSPGPFDHSKLMVVDGAWTLIGSGNWDARSLRLNFELNVECYCADLGGRMEAFALARRAAARQVTLDSVDRRSLPIKLRDGAARLFAPFL
jgi:cardiolipin synthase